MPSIEWVALATSVSSNLSAAGPVILSILGGAGGAALYEVFWQPRRNRRKAATVLLSEILNNTQRCLLQATARQKAPKRIPADFYLELQGWDAVQDKLSELPPDIIKSVMLIYSYFRSLNHIVQLYSHLLDRIDGQPLGGSLQQAKAPIALWASLDAFNKLLDRTIEHAKKLNPELFKLSRLKGRGAKTEDLRDYAKDVEDLLSEREARIQAFLAKDQPQGGSHSPSFSFSGLEKDESKV